MDKEMSKADHHFLGSGWSFPVTFSAGNHELNLSAYEENINESIDIILQTRYGERCMEGGFGGGLQQFIFKKMDETLKGEITEAVNYALMYNEPRITVTNVDVQFTDIRGGAVEIFVTYVYNMTNTRHNYVFPFYINEGTNLI
jgi:phage baseplate assembly protein W